jgi:hypothetical protein
MGDVTFSAYSKIEAVNWSRLKEMRRSPRHYRFRLENEREDSLRLALGRATHTAVFEPDRFLLDYALFSGPIRRGKEWDACCAANRGKTILKAEEYETCLAMRDAVRSHPVAGPALTPPGEAEKTIVWTDERTGIQCKGRIDWWRVGLLCDLKTTTDVDAERFQALSWRMGYHGQGAFYRAGLQALGLDIPPFTIIAVEAAAPHDVAMFELDDDLIYAGELMVAECLDMVSAGRFSGQWPGRYPEKRTLSLPRWARASGEAGDLDALGLMATGTEG